VTKCRPLDKLVVACCCLAVTALVTAPAVLAESTTTTTPLHDPAGDRSPLHLGADSSSGAGVGAGAAFRVIAGLAIVLAVVYGVYWLLKAGARARRPAGAPDMRIVAQTTLAQGRAMHLVRVGDELILMATSENAVAPVRIYEGDKALRLEAVLDQPVSPTEAQKPTLAKLIDELKRRTAR
jgi:flagellar biogenesis protein FliO